MHGTTFLFSHKFFESGDKFPDGTAFDPSLFRSNFGDDVILRL